MNFLDIYQNKVSQKYPEWDLPIDQREHYQAIRQLSEILDSIIPPEIHKQELSNTIGNAVYTAIASMSIQGASTLILANDIKSALDLEIPSIWASPWMALKTASLAITPTPPPVITLPVSAGGEAVMGYFNARKSSYKINEAFMLIGESLAEYLRLEYPKHIKATYSGGKYIPV